MHLPTRYRDFRPLPWIAKVVSLLLIAVCLIMGVVGVLLPIIPGVLFFFIAALLCTRVSQRAYHYAHANAWYRRHLDSWHRSNRLPVLSRLKIAGLLAIRSVADAIVSLGKMLARWRQRP